MKLIKVLQNKNNAGDNYKNYDTEFSPIIQTSPFFY